MALLYRSEQKSIINSQIDLVEKMLSMYEKDGKSFREKIVELTANESEEGAVRRRLINADFYNDLRLIV